MKLKFIIAIMILTLGSAVAGFAQSNQEAFIGYTESYGTVKLAAVPTANDKKAYSEGFTLGYTYYVKRNKTAKPGKFGVTMDVNAQFNDAHPVTATWTGGLVYKPTLENRVQPFVRVMAGIGRLGFKQVFVNGVGLASTSKYSPAYVGGAGFDIASKKNPRLKLRIGADYVFTQFANRNQQFVRATTGLVF